MSSKKGTIKLNGDILLKHQLEIPTGTNVTLELQGYSITYDKDEVAIVNNGTLTIVDFTDGENTLEAGEQSLVRNSVGTAIENNGTLTLGIDDATYNANSPVVQGGITGATAIIYDGKVINN